MRSLKVALLFPPFLTENIDLACQDKMGSSKFHKLKTSSPVWLDFVFNGNLEKWKTLLPGHARKIFTPRPSKLPLSNSIYCNCINLLYQKNLNSDWLKIHVFVPIIFNLTNPPKYPILMVIALIFDAQRPIHLHQWFLPKETTAVLNECRFFWQETLEARKANRKKRRNYWKWMDIGFQCSKWVI